MNTNFETTQSPLKFATIALFRIRCSTTLPLVLEWWSTTTSDLSDECTNIKNTLRRRCVTCWRFNGMMRQGLKVDGDDASNKWLRPTCWGPWCSKMAAIVPRMKFADLTADWPLPCLHRVAPVFTNSPLWRWSRLTEAVGNVWYRLVFVFVEYLIIIIIINIVYYFFAHIEMKRTEVVFSGCVMVKIKTTASV